MLLAVPFSLVGSFWFLYLLGYNMSIAVWVGIIALAGLDAETGVVMLLYLELAHAEWEQKGKLKTIADLKEAVMHGAVKRIRPEDHDGRGDPGRSYPRHVQPRRGIGHHEEDRRPYGGRRRHVDNPGAGHLPRHLHAVEGEGVQERKGGSMRSLFFMTAVLLIIPGICVAAGYVETAKTGGYSVRATFDKSRPVPGPNRVEIAVTDTASHPVREAQVRIDYSMPSLPGKPPMMAYSTAAKPIDGRYEATIDLTMKGLWKMEVSITTAQRTEKAVFSFEVR